MAHSLQAKKRIRQTEKRNARNKWRKKLIREATNELSSAITAQDPAQAEEALNAVVSTLDKAAVRSTMHKNTARRKRSRLAKKVNALKSAEAAKA